MQTASGGSANLDLLRAMAVMFVLGDHTAKYFGFDHIGRIDINQIGYLGVLWFFVHTSLVLMQSIDREWRASTGVSLSRRVASFYVRRAWRIYPLAIAAIAIVFLFRIPAQSVIVLRGSIGGSQPFSGTLADLGADLTLTEDLTGSPNIIGVLWSLPLELRMYLVLPFLYFLWQRRRSPWLMIGLWALAAAWIIADLPKAGFSVVPYVPCFMGGVVAYALGKSGRRRSAPSWGWFPFLVLLAIAMLLAPVASLTRYVGCLALGLAIPLVREIQLGWLRKSAAEIALYSYGIYLLHVPLLWLTVYQLRRWPRGLQLLPFLVSLTLACTAGYRFIEEPGIALGKRFARRIAEGARLSPTSAVSPP